MEKVIGWVILTPAIVVCVVLFIGAILDFLFNPEDAFLRWVVGVTLLLVVGTILIS